MEDKPQGNQVALLDQQIKDAKSVMELLTKPDIRSRAITGYVSMTNRNDGETRFNNERAAYLEIINQKPELKAASMFVHFKVINKVMHSGLSLRDNKLYLQAIRKGDETVDIKVDPSPAGRREMMELMPNIKEVPEAQVVVKGDIFIEDKLNHRIIRHEATEKSLAPDNLDNILYSYQRIIYKNGDIKDVVVPHYDLVKAKSKSKIKGDGGVWEWVAEACKKVSTNRAFRLYHKYPDRAIILDDDKEDETTDADHQDVTDSYQEPEQLQQRTDVDLTTGEAFPEAEPEQPTVQPSTGKKKNLLAE